MVASEILKLRSNLNLPRLALRYHARLVVIFEDISGYTGSLDWTRFYTVVYQTEAFETEPRIKQELARAGTVTWQGILVTGSGGRRLPNKRSPARRRSRLKSAEPSRTLREADQV